MPYQRGADERSRVKIPRSQHASPAPDATETAIHILVCIATPESADNLDATPSSPEMEGCRQEEELLVVGTVGLRF